MIENWEGQQMYGFRDFRSTGHSPGGAERGRKCLDPPATLTTVYAVSIKMTLDERKCLPKPKVIIYLSIKLCHTFALWILQLPQHSCMTLIGEGRTNPTCSLEWCLVYFLFCKLRDMGINLFRKLIFLSQLISTVATSQQQEVCRASEPAVSAWHPPSNIFRILLQPHSYVALC